MLESYRVTLRSLTGTYHIIQGCDTNTFNAMFFHVPPGLYDVRVCLISDEHGQPVSAETSVNLHVRPNEPTDIAVSWSLDPPISEIRQISVLVSEIRQ